jgi:hypothetical protein
MQQQLNKKRPLTDVINEFEKERGNSSVSTWLEKKRMNE